jgi:cytochrome c553
MREHGTFGWGNQLVRRSVLALVALAAVSIVVGFLVLPRAQGDFTTQGLWDSICRAAGVPSAWGPGSPVKQAPVATNVVLERSMANPGATDAIGRGATLALNCTMCHGAEGMSRSDAPNLAGQYQEVVIKELLDYRNGKRSSSIMEALARRLSDRDVTDLSAYFGYLPKARTSPTTYDEALPKLVRVGDPIRNIAPCVACHGGIDQKLGAPWIEGMPKEYLVQQLRGFRSGSRHNDSEAQMRTIARAMTDAEIAEVAIFYAGKASAGGERQ